MATVYDGSPFAGENHASYTGRLMVRETGLMCAFMPQKNSLKTSNVSAQNNSFGVPNPLGLGYRLQMQATDPSSPATIEMFFEGDAFGIIGTVDMGDKSVVSTSGFMPVGITVAGRGNLPLNVSDERNYTVTPFQASNNISLYQWVWRGFGDGAHHVLITCAGDRNYNGSTGNQNRFTIFGFLVPQSMMTQNLGRCAITAVLSNVSTSMSSFNSWNNGGQTPTAITKITAINKTGSASLLKWSINNSSTATGEYNVPAAGANTDSRLVWESAYPVSLNTLQFQAGAANALDVAVYGMVGL